MSTDVLNPYEPLAVEAGTSQPLYATPLPGVGEVFRRAAELCRQNAGSLFALWAVFTLPTYLLVGSLYQLGLVSAVQGSTLASLLVSCGRLIALTAVVYVVVEHARSGRAVSLGPAVLHGLRRALPQLIYGAAVAFAVAAGALCFLIPGVILGVRLSLVPVVVALEDTSAFSRSMDLVRGRSWRVAAISAASVLVVVAFMAPAVVLLGVGTFADGLSAANMESLWGPLILTRLVVSMLQYYLVIVMLVTYTSLAHGDEGGQAWLKRVAWAQEST